MKKELNQQTRQQLRAKKSKSRRWLWWLLLLVLLAAGLLPVYRQEQLAAPERLLQRGIELESQGDFSAAQQLYQQLYADYPQAHLAPEALLRSGRIWQLDRQDEQQALLSFLQLEHDFPASPQALSARQEAARIIKYSLRDYSRAIEAYQRLLDVSPESGDYYLYEIADCYYRLDNYTQARIELGTLLENYPSSQLRPDALYRKAGIHLLDKQPSEAEKNWQQLIEEYPDSDYAVQASFNLAKLLEEQNLLEDALDRYQQLTDFPQQQLLQEKIEHLQKRIASKKKAI